jgi:hypothetical protein
MTKNHVFQYTKTEHIECHYHFIQKKVILEEVAILHIPSFQQQVDIFSKPLKKTKFEGFSSFINLRQNYIFKKWGVKEGVEYSNYTPHVGSLI